ncbi:MAG TPA: FAD-dependent oxidoreductase [Anaerolineae bacterium]
MDKPEALTPQPVAAESHYRADVLVCGGTGCTSSNSQLVLQALDEELRRRQLSDEVRIVPTGCRGFCSMGPVMMIYPEGILYCQVQPSDVPEVVEETFVKGRVVSRLSYEEPVHHQKLPLYHDIPFYGKQIRIALGNCGLIDPENINEYIARDGYQGLAKALTGMTPEDVLREMKDSGLRGRGGAGFLTGLKWELARKAQGSPKYVICNADEGDPGAFMDRSILEGDPHALVEGMTIAAYAIGSREGYIYCRAEYPLAIQRLETAIKDCKELGLLGENILGSDFSFDLYVKQGAGAFVCGEETALMASIEGRRGEPRPRPPFPAVSGLWHKPSNVNNVKSYAMTPRIILRGADWFKTIGTAKSPGTAIFALTGKVRNTGLIEVPMGIPLGEIIFDIGGGIPKGKQFKAVQTGGPLGGCLPAAALNTPVDFDSLIAAGATMGSGGMIVVDEDTCMVEFAKYFLSFASAESCGKCVPCRVGGQRLLEVLTKITDGHGTRKDLETIKSISQSMRDASLCALGQGTPGPVMATLRFFESEFLSHIDDKTCPAGQCKPLVRAKCINACPAGVESPTYLAMVAQGRYAEGLEIHRQRNPFAMICGRVCPAFCEQKCRRGDIDEPIAIRQVKRFMADHEYAEHWLPEITESPKSERVAVIGAGPGGLTAALRLAQRGYKVTVFEKLPVPGGMMTVGIPEYRLPRTPLFAEIENIERAGVQIRCNMALGENFTIEDLFDLYGFKAVVLAIGAHKSRRLGVPGEDRQGVLHGTDFLRNIALAAEANRKAKDASRTAVTNDLAAQIKGKRVAVVGGGDVAIDAARTAWRLGAKEVHIVYRRQRQDMPAHAEEIAAALAEGIQFHYLVNPVRVLGDAAVTGLVIQRQRLGEFDNSGRRRPAPIEGDEYTLDVDVVIPAIGQTTDLSWLREDGKIEATRASTFAVNEAFGTTQPGIFACGDAVSGPATVIQAVAQGNQVAVAVDQWLKTGEMIRPVFNPERTDVPQLYDLDAYADARRPQTPELSVAERRESFCEVEQVLDEQAAREEAKRCLRCDLEWLDVMGIARPVAPVIPLAEATKGGQ